MKRLLSIVALVLLAATVVPGDAQARGRIRFGIGIGLGFPIYPYYPYYPYYPFYPAYPYPAYAYPAAPAENYQPVPAMKATPDPIFYPRSGQDAAQTEADRQACNRWATTQPNALADASVFHRATLACMDGRGYSVR
jgi:hypothetical protein